MSQWVDEMVGSIPSRVFMLPKHLRSSKTPLIPQVQPFVPPSLQLSSTLGGIRSMMPPPHQLMHILWPLPAPPTPHRPCNPSQRPEVLPIVCLRPHSWPLISTSHYLLRRTPRLLPRSHPPSSPWPPHWPPPRPLPWPSPWTPPRPSLRLFLPTSRC